MAATKLGKVMLMTDGEFTSPSVCGPRQIFVTVRVVGLYMCGMLSDEKTSLSFAIAAGTRKAIHSCILVPQDLFYLLRFKTPQTMRVRSLYYLLPLGTGWSSYTPKH